ncbi:MAG: isoleucine--tRNA ligase [Chlamydia sp. 32-24]|nr:MAG: isoleucine--tRNA ligase [Chlamydia sp. 32-24]
MFDALPSESFDERELRILNFWNENNIFQKSLELTSNLTHYTFYDGPPFATGLPHYGHLLAGTIKDVVPRYKTMKGFHVPRRFGWDCHGLPVEQEIEKAFQLSGAPEIEKFGIANFNEECRKIVLRYTSEWKDIVKRMGRWVDFDQTYRTMDLTFMESVWWVFKQLYEKGLVYEGFKVMPFSPKLGTPLSNFEAGENYKEVDDPAITVAFSLRSNPNTSLLAWTTTPWTLVSNLAIMAGSDIDYVEIQDNQTKKNYILSQSNLFKYFKDDTEFTVIRHWKGSELEGLEYEPLFPYFKDLASEGAFKVILDPNVSLEEGTGLVHCAPAFGELDFYACQRANVPLVCPVDNNGKFTNEIPEYTGLFVKDADKDIIKRLKQANHLFHQSTIHHRYPFCWRSDVPLIYKAVTTWFVSVEKIKPALLEANNKTSWTPKHIKQGRFGKWLEGARDWAISRNRYWGTPIPIWRAGDGEVVVIGSLNELEKLTGKKADDLHRHFIDGLTFEKDGKTFRRISEVFDCWFESGSMPYAQNHYPFENESFFNQNFPADFIAEGLDQTRGWFYTLMILSTALFNQPAFKNVIVNGIVLASDGSKMSKRLRNYPDPMVVVKKYGADAIRLYMMHSPAVKAEDLCFSEAGVEVTMRQVLIPMWNAYSFFVTYARIYKWQPKQSPSFPNNILDQWILSLLNKLVKDVEEGLDDYDLSRAVDPFVSFIEQLTNWYIRRSRRRFWNEEDSPDRQEAFETLYKVLIDLTKIAAPFIPFISEAIYQNLKSEFMPDSVHLCSFPVYDLKARNETLEQEMSAVQMTVSMGHALRKDNKLKVRQPLSKAYIVTADLEAQQLLKAHQMLISDELNVKEIDFVNDESKFVMLKAKPNFRVLGKKVGKWMKQAQETISGFSQIELGQLMSGNNVIIHLGGEEFTLTPEDVQVERIVHEGLVAANQGNITIALETMLNEDLILEGLARELVNKLNSMRRDANLAVTDRIRVTIDATEKTIKAYELHKSYINQEILAIEVIFSPNDGFEWDLNGEKTTMAIVKA